LRAAGAEDRPLLLRVYAATRSQEMDLVPWDDAQKQAFIRMQFDAQHRHYTSHYPGARFEVILLDGEPVGRLYLAQLETELRIMDVAVLPENRRAGIGSLVVGDVLKEAHAAGIAVTMSIETYNPSLPLFERMGFHATKVDPLTALIVWKPISAGDGNVSPPGPTPQETVEPTE
jgi:GNAT superfamily N-acetyltransferase